MSNKPFQIRAPDFRRVQYEFTYATEEDAQASYEALKNKMYTLQDRTYILPIGRKIRSKDEAIGDTVVTFTGHLKVSELESTSIMEALEGEVAGSNGVMTSKSVIGWNPFEEEDNPFE